MQIDKKRIEPDITVLEFTGKIVLGRETQRIEWMVEELLRQNERKVIFDLTNVDYIDSAGLGVITSCFGKARECGGALRLAGASDRVMQIFKMTGLDAILPLHPNATAASEGFTVAAPPG
jgi:anti-sigma B factor antagonist